MNQLLIAPFLIPLLTAIATLFAWNRIALQRKFHLMGSALQLVACIWILLATIEQGMLVKTLGSWPAPYGITYVADVFTGIMLSLSSLIGFLVAIYSMADIDEQKQRNGFVFFSQTMIMGVCAAFLTGDLFHMYVSFEIMLLSSFVLVCLCGGRDQFEGGLKYVMMNLFSSIVFLIALGVVYGTTKTLNMADISLRLQELDEGVVLLISMLLLIAFGIKSALFPMFFWLPASYHTPPAAVSALFSGLLTKVGVYALIRVYTLFFPEGPSDSFIILLVIACFTMATGVLGAMAQFEFRKILSFHIISQIGYMVLGLAFFSPLALTASIYFLIHNNFAKCNLFLIGGIAEQIHGSPNLKKMGSLYRLTPYLALLFMISAISLAGLPPTSGFWAKFFLFSSGLALESYIAIIVAALVSICTLLSMTKIWSYAFLRESDEKLNENLTNSKITSLRDRFYLFAPVVIFALFSLIIAFWIEPVFDVCKLAASQLLDSDEYVRMVLGR
jgi:multicomponent Na+:H+ antiporter subunit D